MWNFTSSIPIVHEHPYTVTDNHLQGKTRGTPSGRPNDNEPSSLNGDNGSSLLHCVLAGGIGGIIGDSSMHSLDTVKTRQQGAPMTPKYKNMTTAYRTIFLEEGIARGLYGGYFAAMLGSFPSAAIFFGTYEWCKRKMIGDLGFNDTVSHLSAGLLGDFVSSFVYVPSEVLKTRLQLQGLSLIHI